MSVCLLIWYFARCVILRLHVILPVAWWGCTAPFLFLLCHLVQIRVVCVRLFAFWDAGCFISVCTCCSHVCSCLSFLFSLLCAHAALMIVLRAPFSWIISAHNVLVSSHFFWRQMHLTFTCDAYHGLSSCCALWLLQYLPPPIPPLVASLLLRITVSCVWVLLANLFWRLIVSVWHMSLAMGDYFHDEFDWEAMFKWVSLLKNIVKFWENKYMAVSHFFCKGLA